MTNAKNIYFRIADFNILVSSGQSGCELLVDNVYRPWLCDSTKNINLYIKVICDKQFNNNYGQKVFFAPLINSNSNFLWCIYKDKKTYYALIYGNINDEKKPYMTLKFSTDIKYWELIVPRNTKIINPFHYPMGSIILFYLTQINSAIILHASGIKYQNSGHLFSGFSGTGKSTLANIFYKSGGQIINDDKIILRNIDGITYMFNTPVYDFDSPKKSILTDIFLIKHHTENFITRLNSTNAIARLMAFCIQLHYSPSLIKTLLINLKFLTTKIPVYDMGFKPTKSVIDLINKNSYYDRY
ncbi:hypothetical protein ACFLRG_02390 [Bacteroidota bacterium]